MYEEVKSGKLFVVSAPSGCGKTTLVDAVIKRLSGNFNIEKVVTYTTRQPRTGEVNGIDYNFISVQEFERKIAEQFFIEYSAVYHHYYGSPCHVIDEMRLGKSYIMILDLAGAISMRALFEQARLIWIYPPSLHALTQRLIERGSDDGEQIKRRIFLAKQELSDTIIHSKFDYFLLNDSLQQAIDAFEAILFKELCGK